MFKAQHDHGVASDSDSIRNQHDAERALGEGIAFEQDGCIDQALRRYEVAVAMVPEMARAHFYLGNILLDRGDALGALSAYMQAIKYKPDSAAAHYNMGNARLRLGATEAALESYRQALVLKPEFVDVHVAIGCAQEGLGHSIEALESFGRALVLKPDYAEVHHNIADVMKGLGKFEEAASSYRHLLELRPESAETHSNLASVLMKMGQIDEALAVHRRAVDIAPHLPELHFNLGVALVSTGQLNLAIACFERALEIEPRYIEAQSNLGYVFQNLGQFTSAVSKYRRVLELEPDYVDAHNNLGAALSKLGQFDEAVASFRKAIDLNPDYADAHMNLGSILKDIGQFENALACVRRAMEIRPDYTLAFSNLLLTYNLLDIKLGALPFQEARRFGAMVARLATPYTNWANVRSTEKRLRIGLVSGDFCQHPVGNFLEGVLAAIQAGASGRLRLYAYASSSFNDEVTERIKSSCDSWRSVTGLTDLDFAQCIRDDGIDILVDLSGHTAQNRLPVFAWKPAPVQISWLGYLATTGVAAIDYVIGDAATLIAQDQHNFTEKFWRIPKSYLCFTPPTQPTKVGPLPATQCGYVTFGSFNNLAKLSDSTVALWAKVLVAIPESRLLLKSHQLGEDSVRQRTLSRFMAHGVGEDRIILMAGVPRAQYLEPYNLVDIALDPFPYPGITTTVEALWMGVPVLTLAGENFLSRQGVGLMTNAGLPDWIATDRDDFIARAIAHASDLQVLASLRSTLRHKVLSSPIFDAPEFALHFEAALCGMWREWCESAATPLKPEANNSGTI